MSSSGQFRLSITRALGDQLATALAELTPAPLTSDRLEALSPLPGVYQLYHCEERVYVGKAEVSLQGRLGQHLFKLSGRRNIALDDVAFTCLYVDEDLSAVAPERLLIDTYRAEGSCPWNQNGFGNNDPGRERDTTRVRPDHFDAQFPINLEYACDLTGGPLHMVDLLKELKDSLPFKFRYQGARSRATRLQTYGMGAVGLLRAPLTADALFDLIARDLPPGWQITALPGYVIMYKERRPYPSATKTYRSSAAS
jgi:hypothetical protein